MNKAKQKFLRKANRLRKLYKSQLYKFEAGEETSTFHIRRTLFNLQKGRCCWCNKRCSLIIPPKGTLIPKNMATIEHIKPLSLGGTNQIDNLKMACYKCNSERTQNPKEN